MVILKYKTITENKENYLLEKKSKFFAYILKVKNEDDVKRILKKIRKEHFKANHIPYAYRCDLEHEMTGFSDDGEPTGSSGKPIYFELKGAKLWNTLIVIARYFGGIKLGVGGIARAISEVSKGVIQKCEIVDETYKIEEKLSFSYDKRELIDKHLKENNIDIIKKEFNEFCNYTLVLDYSRRKELDKVKALLLN